MKIRKWLILILLLSACSSSSKPSSAQEYPTPSETSPSPTRDQILMPEASGSWVKGDDLVQIDASHANEGYIMAKTLRTDHRRIKLKIIKDGEEYPYDINKDLEYETYPLSLGSGEYQIKAYENIEDTRYAVLFTLSLEVTLDSEITPFLYPNQIVDYTPDSETVLKSFELTAGKKTELERVKAIYDYVTQTIRYDWDKVEAVQDKFVLPVIDETLDSKKGICFDYAAVMSAMLRVQHIPTRLLTGYVDEGYHSWVETYVESEGWINPEIYFESETWKRMDPTYAASDVSYSGEYQDKYRY